MKIVMKLGPRQFHCIEKEQEDAPDHPAIMVGVNPALRSMDLTVLTGEEIQALRKFWNDTLDKAEAVVTELDAIAAAAAENGNTNFKRLWRPAPVRHDFA